MNPRDTAFVTELLAKLADSTPVTLTYLNGRACDTRFTPAGPVAAIEVREGDAPALSCALTEQDIEKISSLLRNGALERKDFAVHQLQGTGELSLTMRQEKIAEWQQQVRRKATKRDPLKADGTARGIGE